MREEKRERREDDGDSAQSRRLAARGRQSEKAGERRNSKSKANAKRSQVALTNTPKPFLLFSFVFFCFLFFSFLFSLLFSSLLPFSFSLLFSSATSPSLLRQQKITSKSHQNQTKKSNQKIRPNTHFKHAQASSFGRPVRRRRAHRLATRSPASPSQSFLLLFSSSFFRRRQNSSRQHTEQAARRNSRDRRGLAEGSQPRVPAETPIAGLPALCCALCCALCSAVSGHCRDSAKRCRICAAQRTSTCGTCGT